MPPKISEPIFAVQSTGRDDTEVRLTVEALNSLSFEWKEFGLIYFCNDITNLDAFPNDRTVIPLAGTKILKLWRDEVTPRNWKIWYDPLFMDQFNEFLWDDMLNAGSEFSTFSNGADRKFYEDVFVKPTDDGKAFAGAIIPAGTSLNDHLKKVTHQEIHPEQKIMFAPVRDIDREFRCVVIDNKVVDISEYKSRAGIKAKVVDDSMRAWIEDYIESLGYDIKLACVDVCEVLNADGTYQCLKIVEINCFHCSGLYKLDRVKVFRELRNAVVEGRI